MRKLRIAVIGTGIAGNVAAAKLSPAHDITVFEAANYVGGHANTVELKDGPFNIALDTGFLVFNDRTYPEFVKLLDELGVRSLASDMSFSVQCDDGKIEYCGSTLNSLCAQRRNIARPKFQRMVRQILRFNREAKSIASENCCDATLAEFLARNNYSDEFINWYLIPMGAAIWSAKSADMRNVPMLFLARFFENHGLLDLKNRPQWKTIAGGSRSYVERLVAGHKDKICLNSKVVEVERRSDSVRVTLESGARKSFDHVLLACHSDDALRMISDPHPLERSTLRAFEYQKNDAILHTDRSLMPSRRLAWAAWNHHSTERDDGRVGVTYYLNKLQHLPCTTDFFVSLNSAGRIAPEHVLKSIEYDHPVFSRASIDAQRNHRRINGLNRTWYCGAYWGNGFHEDGVVSALRTVEQLMMEAGREERHFQRAS